MSLASSGSGVVIQSQMSIVSAGGSSRGGHPGGLGRLACPPVRRTDARALQFGLGRPGRRSVGCPSARATLTQQGQWCWVFPGNKHRESALPGVAERCRALPGGPPDDARHPRPTRLPAPSRARRARARTTGRFHRESITIHHGGTHGVSLETGHLKKAPATCAPGWFPPQRAREPVRGTGKARRTTRRACLRPAPRARARPGAQGTGAHC